MSELIEGARLAVASGARRYCMVCSMRGLAARDVEHLAAACESIRVEFPDLELCLSIGLLEQETARRLKRGWRRLDQSQPQHQPPLLP